MTTNQKLGAAVAQEVGQLVWKPEGCWFDPLCSAQLNMMEVSLSKALNPNCSG